MRTPLIAAGISGVLLVGASTAYAAVSSSGVDSSGTIHGCYNRYNGDLRVINSTDTCRRYELAVNWNKIGRAGPAGAVGPAGPAGPTGATGPAGPSTLGPAGLDVIEVQVSTDGIGSATAQCPASHPYVISGGGSVFNPPVGFVATPAAMAASFPVSAAANDPTGWAVIAVNTKAEPSPTGQISGVSAYADCVK